MSDRLPPLKAHLQQKLEDAIEHTANLAKLIGKAQASEVQLLCTEMQETQREIEDLRNALHYIADWEIQAQALAH